MIIGKVENYALDQLDAIGKDVSRPKAREQAEGLERARNDVAQWLAVLAHCDRLQSVFDELQDERERVEAGDGSCQRFGRLDETRDRRRLQLSSSIQALLDAVDQAVGRANDRMLLDRKRRSQRSRRRATWPRILQPFATSSPSR